MRWADRREHDARQWGRDGLVGPTARHRSLDDRTRRTHHRVVAELSFRDRRRVFVPQALGANEYLRVTWHETDRVVVFSHWQGEVCVAATPVRVTETAELATLLVEAL